MVMIAVMILMETLILVENIGISVGAVIRMTKLVMVVMKVMVLR